jgi:hypothetical protein
LGVEVFLPFCPDIVCAHLNRFMRDAVCELSNVEEISADAINEVVTAMVSEADRLKMDTLVNGRAFDFDFMGHVVSLRTHTAIEQARHHVAAAVKTIAVKAGLLPQMSIEKDVPPIETDLLADAPTVHKDVLDQFSGARSCMENELGKANLTVAFEYGELLDNMRAVWWLRDPTFVLEIEYIRNLAGPIGGQKLVEQALAVLPTKEVCPPYNLVADGLRKFEHTKAWVFSTPEARGIVASMLEVVVAMERGEGPSVAQFPRGTKMEAVGNRLGFSCFFSVASSSTKSNNLYGKDAADHLLKKLKESIEKNTIVDLAPVTQCQVFRWLFDHDQMKALDELSEKAYNIVIHRTSGAVADHSDAMGVMVAAAATAKTVLKKGVLMTSKKVTKPLPKKKTVKT